MEVIYYKNEFMEVRCIDLFEAPHLLIINCCGESEIINTEDSWLSTPDYIVATIRKLWVSAIEDRERYDEEIKKEQYEEYLDCITWVLGSKQDIADLKEGDPELFEEF